MGEIERRDKMSDRNIFLPGDYGDLLLEVKARVRAAQYEALKAINKELVGLYWDIEWMIVERQRVEGWGDLLWVGWWMICGRSFLGLGVFRRRIYGG